MNSEHSLFKLLQLFVISNGTDTRYFANTTQRDKNSFDFTMNWAKADNSLLKDVKDFTATFFQTNTLLEVLLKYSVFDVSNTLLVMRPCQIAATEHIMRKINSSHTANAWSKPERIREISQYILTPYRQKTHWLRPSGTGFNAMFAVSSVDAAIADYNAHFKTSFSVDSNGFQNYYRDLAKRVKSRDIDLLVVVGMFLTGFDTPTWNTLLVDKNLHYHSLIQAF